MVKSVNDPDEFVSKVLQTPDLARIEEESYDEDSSMITFKVYLSGSLSQQVREDETSNADMVRERLLGLGAESVTFESNSEVSVEFPLE